VLGEHGSRLVVGVRRFGGPRANGVREVGEDTGAEGGGQWKRVATMTYMMLWQVVLLSCGHSSAKRLYDGCWRTQLIPLVSSTRWLGSVAELDPNFRWGRPQTHTNILLILYSSPVLRITKNIRDHHRVLRKLREPAGKQFAVVTPWMTLRPSRHKQSVLVLYLCFYSLLFDPTSSAELESWQVAAASQ
jgi:hypothetical protein